MPPNMITAALEMTSAVVSAAAAVPAAAPVSAAASRAGPVATFAWPPAAAASSDGGPLAGEPPAQRAEGLGPRHAGLVPAGLVLASIFATRSRARVTGQGGHGADDRRVPAEHRRGVGATQAESLGNDRHGQRAGQGAPQVRGAVGPHGRHQAIGFRHHERGQP
jgi:hypothetical protein